MVLYGARTHCDNSRHAPEKKGELHIAPCHDLKDIGEIWEYLVSVDEPLDAFVDISISGTCIKINTAYSGHRTILILSGLMFI